MGPTLNKMEFQPNGIWNLGQCWPIFHFPFGEPGFKSLAEPRRKYFFVFLQNALSPFKYVFFTSIFAHGGNEACRILWCYFYFHSRRYFFVWELRINRWDREVTIETYLGHTGNQEWKKKIQVVGRKFIFSLSRWASPCFREARRSTFLLFFAFRTKRPKNLRSTRQKERLNTRLTKSKGPPP